MVVYQRQWTLSSSRECSWSSEVRKRIITFFWQSVFEKLRTKFCQNRPSFIEDMTKNDAIRSSTHNSANRLITCPNNKLLVAYRFMFHVSVHSISYFSHRILRVCHRCSEKVCDGWGHSECDAATFARRVTRTTNTPFWLCCIFQRNERWYERFGCSARTHIRARTHTYIEGRI